jgi:signal peptidase I
MRGWLKRNRGVLVFLLCLGIFRTAVADWNPVPTGSMRPTILEGDVVLVDRLAYDLKLPLSDIILVPLGDPRRGDIATFSSPVDGMRLIKRIVAIPGDTVELRGDTLFINGVAARYAAPVAAPGPLAGDDGGLAAVRARERIAGSTRTVQFLPQAPAMRDFGPLTIPADSYFMMGDNRDDSEDSRYIGVVPRHLLIGRAGRLLVSADIKGHWQLRFGRFGKSLQ